MPRPFNTSQPLGQIMKRDHWTVDDLAACSGVSYRTISDYLAGRRPIIADHRARLADALGVDGGDLGHAPSPDTPFVRPAVARAVSIYG